jgi:hypothetical protein
MKMNICKKIGAAVIIGVMGNGGVAQSQVCNPYPDVCDAEASYIGLSMDFCTNGSTGPCDYLVSDQLVNCSPANNASCQNDGTQLTNVENIMMVGNCDGDGNCVASVSSKNYTTRCEKTTSGPCLFAKNTSGLSLLASR